MANMPTIVEERVMLPYAILRSQQAKTSTSGQLGNMCYGLHTADKNNSLDFYKYLMITI